MQTSQSTSRPSSPVHATSSSSSNSKENDPAGTAFSRTLHNATIKNKLQSESDKKPFTSKVQLIKNAFASNNSAAFAELRKAEGSYTIEGDTHKHGDASYTRQVTKFACLNVSTKKNFGAVPEQQKPDTPPHFQQKKQHQSTEIHANHPVDTKGTFTSLSRDAVDAILKGIDKSCSSVNKALAENAEEKRCPSATEQKGRSQTELNLTSQDTTSTSDTDFQEALKLLQNVGHE